MTTSANGLSKTTQWEFDGSGTVSRTQTDVTVKRIDGGMTETITARNSDGSLYQEAILTTSADGQVELWDATRLGETQEPQEPLGTFRAHPPGVGANVPSSPPRNQVTPVRPSTSSVRSCSATFVKTCWRERCSWRSSCLV